MTHAIGVLNGNWKSRWRRDLEEDVRLTYAEELAVYLDVAQGMTRQTGFPEIQERGEQRVMEIQEQLRLIETITLEAQALYNDPAVWLTE